MSRLKGHIAIFSALLTLCVLLEVRQTAARPPMQVAAMAKTGGPPVAVTVMPHENTAVAAAPMAPGLVFQPGWKGCPHVALLHACANGGASLKNPICGVSEAGMVQNFSNRCLFDYHNCISKGNWVVLHDGPC